MCQEYADLVAIGAYKAGANRSLDFALSKIDAVNAFLRQGTRESFSYEETMELLTKTLQ